MTLQTPAAQAPTDSDEPIMDQDSEPIDALPLGVPPSENSQNGPAEGGRRAARRSASVQGIVATGTGRVSVWFRRRLMPALRGAWLRVVELFAPVLSIVSPLGYLVLFIGISGLWAGYAYGWLELVAIGWASISVFACATLFILGRSSYEIELVLATNRVIVGDRAVGQVTVRNLSHRSMAASRIELPVGSAAASFDVPRMGHDTSDEYLFAIPTHRRSVIAVGPVTSVRGDPLGLLRRTVQWTEVRDLYVHPRSIRVDAASTGLIRDIEGLPTRDLSVSDLSFHALREYVPGDDRRAVHWKTSARVGQLMVRQFEESRRSNLLVLLPTARVEYASPEEFELAISVAASFALQAFREDRHVSVVVSDRTLHTASAPRFLDQLSGLEARPRVAGLAAIASRSGSTIIDASVAVLLCGSTTSATELRTAAARLPLGVVALAVRCAPGLEPGRARIAEMDVLTVNFLDELPRSLRMVAT